MANIMITSNCNLRCNYCFASEFVNNNTNNMSLEDFKTAIEFVLADKGDRVGIIGGEPSVHPLFKEILECLIYDERLKQVTLFTNNLNTEGFMKQLVNNKFFLLINCNSPKDIGEKSFSKLVRNLEIMINDYYMKPRITLGITMYKPNFDYKYIVELLLKFNFKTVRTSIAVPNNDYLRNNNSLEYFRNMKDSVFDFFKELYYHQIMPTFDCNLMPYCILDEKEIDWLREFYKMEDVSKKRCNLLEYSKCMPVIDILPNLMAVRCFGLSEYVKVPIKKFSNLNELGMYFYNLFDVFAYNTFSSKECINCDRREKMMCSGGCFAFKNNKIEQARNICLSI